MKTQLKLWMLLAIASFAIFSGCKKEDSLAGSSTQLTASYNAEVGGAPTAKATAAVPLKWYNLIIDLTRTVPFQGAGPIASRLYGYIGLALYESVVPGMPMYQSLQGQLNGLTALPQPDANKKYFYPACANAALASMVHYMFGNATTEQNYSIDSLEDAIYTSFQSMPSEEVLGRSVSFGKDISTAIYNWSKTDGGDQAYLNPFPPYTPPVGPQYWVPQTGQSALLPYWGNNRTFIVNNATSTQPPPPIPYSTDPHSEFYREEMAVYRESINQDPEHTAAALYWNSLVATGAGISIIGDILTNKSTNLATAAEVYCKAGMAMADAEVSNWKTKYKYVQVRPITYIKANIDTGWTPLLATPPYPDYTSGYTIIMTSCLMPLADMFGNNTTFTCPSINSLGQEPRVFNSFSECVREVSRSRFYGGIHIISSCYAAIAQGALLATHVSALKFKRG